MMSYAHACSEIFSRFFVLKPEEKWYIWHYLKTISFFKDILMGSK